MIYNFKGFIFSEDQRAFIKIPINLWNEYNLKGRIPAEVLVDKTAFECTLIPKGNGLYYIPVNKSLKVPYEKELNIKIKFISQLTRINNNSPYSLENPIRKIDNIKLVASSKKGTCGQAILAMLTGLSFDEIVKLMGKACSMSKVIEALDYYGIVHSDKMIYKIDKDSLLPKCCIINVKGHMLLYFNGKFYDSYEGILDSFKISSVTSYLEILC